MLISKKNKRPKCVVCGRRNRQAKGKSGNKGMVRIRSRCRKCRESHLTVESKTRD